MMEKLLGKTLDELKEVCKESGLPIYNASQIAQWLYSKHVSSFNEMTNLSLKTRAYLSEHYAIGAEMPLTSALSKDGTRKYLFPTNTSKYVEAVMIPEEDRATLCVSSQAGCKMGCKFCMTGRQGFKGNLDVAEILSQFFYIDEADKLTNAVFMGMGEPLDNIPAVMRAIEVLTAKWGCGWSPKRITLSSIGVNRLVEGDGKSPLEQFLDGCKAHLAISMHNPFPAERREIMPSEKLFGIDKTLEIIKRYDFTGQRRVSFEYIMFDGLNDTKRHADAIISKLRGLECRVNLIRFHNIGDTKFITSKEPVIEKFMSRLNNAGITATVRASRGEDIAAACGMLSGQKEKSDE
ncbi:MAG: 23S rRNA (adenine(2503)-C(2))-methyltransferase RlmN [Candidatus Egerieousia sp.]